MAGLLDFALGFGAGAAGGFVEQKKSDLEAQRQANLARLQAKYKADAEFAQAQRAGRLVTSGRPEDLATAQFLGYTPPKPAEPQSPLGRLYADRQRAAQSGNQDLVALYDEAIEREARGTQTTGAQSTIGKLFDDYDAAIAAGNQEEADKIYDRIEKEIAPSSPLITYEGQQQSEFATKVGSADAETVSNIRRRALRASNQVSELDRIEAALESERFTTGVLARPRVFLAELASFAGLDPEANPTIKKLFGSAPTADTIDSAANLIATNLLGDVSQTADTRSSNMLLNLILESGPQLSRTLEGNQLILEALRRKAEQDMAVSEIVNSYVRVGTPYPEGEEDMYSAIIRYQRENPVVTPEFRQRISSARANAPTPEEVETLPRVEINIDNKNLSREEYNDALDDAGILSGQTYIDGSGKRLIRP